MSFSSINADFVPSHSRMSHNLGGYSAALAFVGAQTVRYSPGTHDVL